MLTITWEKIASICPKETAAIIHLLHKEWDINFPHFLRGICGHMDWHDVIDIRGYGEPVSEIEEAKLEESLIKQLQELWESLMASFEQATESEGLCYSIVAFHFEDEDSFKSPAVFEIERAPAMLSASQLVERGETLRCEYKSTLRVNLHTGKEDKKIEHSCLKTIAAFLNTHGGYLLIGVNDQGKPLGIEADGFPNEDKMQLHLVNILKQRIGAENLVQIEPRFETLEDKRVLVVKCRPSNLPVYLKDGSTEQFYVRTGPATAELLPSQIQGYSKQRF